MLLRDLASLDTPFGDIAIKGGGQRQHGQIEKVHACFSMHQAGVVHSDMLLKGSANFQTMSKLMAVVV